MTSSSAHDQELFALDANLGSAVLAEEDLVANLEVTGTHMSTFEDLALADCDNCSVNGLFGGRIGNCDAPRGGAIFLQALHDDTVMKGTNPHS